MSPFPSDVSNRRNYINTTAQSSMNMADSNNLYTLVQFLIACTRALYSVFNMKFKSLVLAGLMAGGTVGSAVPKAPYHFGCGAPPPSDSHRAVSKELAVQEAAFNSGLQINAASIVVDTYIHVVSIDQTATGGYLSVSKQ